MAIAMSPFRNILIAFLISSSALFNICRASSGGGGEVAHEKPFTYEDTDVVKGPKKWGTLKPEWKICGNGKLQSPVDIINEIVQVQESLGSLQIMYKTTPANITNRGHDISVAWEGEAGGVIINCTHYKLAQIHWHSPSEHTVNGTSYDLEGHIVHKSVDGGIAVIGILYKIGNPDPFLSKVLGNIKTITEEGTDLGDINPNDIIFNRNQYYRYIGSLTTPPCTEGVIWTVIKEVRTVSVEQLNALKDAVHDGYEKNARPVQNANGRIINLSSQDSTIFSLVKSSTN
ncbi:dehydratase [Lithospermum erythrorhizon]|uniref:Carbonic anhydrase n=1 Tax=Lithospermum erythrorhizon TaxID=34254 RepID=A0AAV3R9G3_LITER